MPASGKYDFQGIQKMGLVGLTIALSNSPYTAWITKFPLSNLILQFLINWAVNNGLVLLNLGAIYVEGEIDQHAMDSAMTKAMDQISIKQGRDKLTDAEKKAIDDQVIKAARKFIVINNS